MLGTIVNSFAIIAGGLFGVFLGRGIPERYKDIILNALSLSVILIGVKNGLVTDDLLVVVFSLVFGAVLGEAVEIENKLENLARYFEARVAIKTSDSSSFAKGFVTASLIYCVGSMAIVGSLESGLTGNHQTLFVKSVLDGVTSIIFASTMGLGVIFSSVAVFLYQGAITLAATVLKPYLVSETVSQMTSVGGLLIMAIGFNMLNVTKIKIGNLLPAIFLPLFYYIFLQFIN